MNKQLKKIRVKMNVNVEGKKLRIPKYVTMEYMMKLDADSLRNLCQTNKEYLEFCRRTDIWKRFVKRDFPTEPIATYVNEPNWMRVYYWFRKKNALKEKLQLRQQTFVLFHSIPIFLSSLDTYGSTRVSYIAGALLSLGAETTKDNLLVIYGKYLGKYEFSITMGDKFTKIGHNLHKSSKILTQLIDDVKTLLLMTEPIEFKIDEYGYTLLLDKVDTLFNQDIPNYALENPYSYLYTPELTINENVISEEIIVDYISSKLLPLTPIIIPKTITNEDVFDLIPTSYLDIDREDFALGVYNGTPFLIIAYANDQNLYLLCPSPDPSPLVDELSDLLK